MQDATGGRPGGAQPPPNLDDYNPFDKQATTATTAPGSNPVGGDTNGAPAVMKTSSENAPPPPYEQTSAPPQISTADFQVEMIVSCGDFRFVSVCLNR